MVTFSSWAIASQLIVLHHLAFYGPMSDYVQTICPETIAWLSQHARIAVQAFLVMGGFLAAQALTRDGKLTDRPVLQLIRKRYIKLVTPYLVALALAVAGAAIARSLITHDSIPGAPTIAQLVAHTMLLQSVLGFDGLSAGVWYVAIDFQLYVFLLIVIWLSRRLLPEKPSASLWCVLAFITASLFIFNRDASWDNWAVYFFGAYGLGAVTYWCTQPKRVSLWFIAALLLAVIALWFDFRTRILVALLFSCGLGIARTTGGWSAMGQPGLVSGNVVTLAAAGKLGGQYLVTSSAHRLSRSAGYVTDVQACRVAGAAIAYSSNATAPDLALSSYGIADDGVVA